MAVVNLKGSRIMTPIAASPATKAAPGTGGGAVRSWTETVEVTASDSETSTYLLARLPSNARIMGLSTFSWDDLSTDGTSTMDLGVFNQSGKSDITDDPDALSNGHAITGASSALVIGEKADYGIQLWDHATGTTDPVAMLDIKATLNDLAVTAAGGGTITIELLYTLD
jgi:hypothetical protein